MNYLNIIVVSFVLIGVIGCHPRIKVDHRSPPPRHETVVIQSTHTHNDDCGHTWDGGTWIEVHGHRHGRGCGHLYSGGRWTLDIKKGHHGTKVEVHTPRVDVKVKKHH